MIYSLFLTHPDFFVRNLGCLFSFETLVLFYTLFCVGCQKVAKVSPLTKTPCFIYWHLDEYLFLQCLKYYIQTGFTAQHRPVAFGTVQFH